MATRAGLRKFSWLFAAERTLLTIGIVMLTCYAAATMYTAIASHVALQAFFSSQPRVVQTNAASATATAAVDFALWNPKRIEAYKQSLLQKTERPVAVLRVPKIHLEVPVFDGTDDLTLNRGAGRIVGTARVGETGNIGIAAHRDGFFRGLKDVGPGDAVDLVTQSRTIHYVVRQIKIVQPEDVGVLADTGTPSLTLVTCFPFNFIGNAPQRFIVHASETGFKERDRRPAMSDGYIKSKENFK